MTKYRVDKAREYEDAVNKMWDQWGRSDTASQTGSVEDQFDADPVRARQGGVAERLRVDVERQHTDNLVAQQFTDPEAFGRNRSGNKIVVKSSEAHTGYSQMPPSHGGISSRIGRGYAGGQRSGPGHAEVPMFMQQPIDYDEAVATVEKVGIPASEFLNSGMTGAVAEMMQKGPATQHPSQARRRATPAEQHYFDANAGGVDLDVTNPNWDGESYYASLGPNRDEIEGGVSPTEFCDPDGTKTYFGRPV